MQFCPTCDNKLYMRIHRESDDEKIAGQSHHKPNITSSPLVLYCKNCTFFTELKDTGTNLPVTFDPCMYRSNYSKEHPLYYSTIVNTYTVNDPTLPRTSDMPCPNNECKTKHDDDCIPEVLYIRYNDDDMKYLYICKHCKWCWRTPSYQVNKILFKL